MYFEVTVRARVSGIPFIELITAKNKEHAVEKMGNVYQSLTSSELKKAAVKPISREFYVKETRRRYAIREARERSDK